MPEDDGVGKNMAFTGSISRTGLLFNTKGRGKEQARPGQGQAGQGRARQGTAGSGRAEPYQQSGDTLQMHQLH